MHTDQTFAKHQPAISRRLLGIVRLKTVETPRELIGRLIEIFYRTQQAKELKNLLDNARYYFEETSFTAIYQFLTEKQTEQYIRQKDHTDVLYAAAIQMIGLINRKEYQPTVSLSLLTAAKLCVHQMLKISAIHIVVHYGIWAQKIQHPQRTLDHLQWRFFLTVPKYQHWNKDFCVELINSLSTPSDWDVSHRPLFLQLVIVHLCIFFMLSNHFFKVDIDLKKNRFLIYAQGQSSPVGISSQQLERLIEKLPHHLSPEDVDGLTTLFDSDIHYQKWGYSATVPVPIRNPCWKIIWQILENKLIPLLLQHQRQVVTEMTVFLPTLPLVLMKLIYEYYNTLHFFPANIVSNSSVSNSYLSLFYHPPKIADCLGSSQSEHHRATK